MLRLFRALLILTMLCSANLLSAKAKGELEPEGEASEPRLAVAQEPAASEVGDAGADVTQDAEGLIPMDDATAEVLYKMGIYAFQDRIPSENFVLANLRGDDIQLFEQSGKVVFLNFWATWCGPCREEMPSMQALYDELKDEGLEIIAVNVLEDHDTASGFVEEHGFTYPVVLDRDGKVMLRYGIRAYPTTYIVDRDGYVLGVRPGYNDWATDEVVSAFRTLLAQ